MRKSKAFAILSSLNDSAEDYELNSKPNCTNDIQTKVTDPVH